MAKETKAINISFLKPVWQSKTVWACLVALVLAVMAAAGVGGFWVEVIIALASAFGIYGRVTATTQIKSMFK
jgi:Na+-transporting NADH:ubiquinone oxidoreductase subunit NqrA